MNKYDFKNISIRGRVAFAISCLNTYLKTKYPNIDFSSVLDLACKITEDSDYIDSCTEAFTEIIPEYLYEFDNYEDAEFEYLSKEAYESFISIIPKDDADLNLLMHSIRDIAWEYCYVALETNAPQTYRYLDSIIDTMNKLSLSLPDIKIFKKYEFSENDGWGRHINRSEYL